MKIAVVVQRYGTDVVGGAETHSRKIAERLSSDLGWDVEVLTTTAVDYRTWANYYPAGTEVINGIVVRRFKTIFQRFFLFNLFHRIVCRYLPSLERRAYLRFLVRPIECLWYILQGPYSPSLVRYIRNHGEGYKAIFYFTYLYHPTVMGIELHKSKSFLIPEAHDEPPFYFRGSARALRSAVQILANTPSEIRLIERRLPDESLQIQTAGMGIDLRIPDDPELGALSGKVRKPYILYLGRVGPAKMVHVLFQNFLDYIKATNDQATTLVLAGGQDKDFSIPKHPQIQYLGFVSEDDKARIIKNSLCVVNPSAFESLSIIVAEAITLLRPVIVNGHCEVLRDYREIAKSVFPYYNSEDFTRILSEIIKQEWDINEDRKAILEDAKVAVDKTFQWPNIVEVYRVCVEALGKP